MGEAKYGGSVTMADGTRRTLSPEEAEQLWLDAERRRTERAERMPDEQSAIRQMTDAFDRLKDLGWRDAIYCPKDGTLFDAIEAGSTGIHDCNYQGKWPDGHWWVFWEGDCGPSRPVLFRPKTLPPPPAREGE